MEVVVRAGELSPPAMVTGRVQARLTRQLARSISAGGIDWKKLVAGKKLWNFSKHEYDAWRGAL